MDSTQKKPPLKKWLSTRDVADLLQAHVTTVRRWSRSGFIKSYRIGARGHRRYLQEDILLCLTKISSDQKLGE